jgi:carbon monoxide dehydrogenase subunit G
MVDVTVKTEIDAPPEKVAAIMFDAERDPQWIGGAKKAQKLTPGPYGVGTKVRREGAFLGRSFSWTTEVTELTSERLVRMKHIAGPFKGGVDYSIEPKGRGSDVTIRNYGEASFWFPFMATMMRASVRGDLGRLKALVETSG